MKPIGHISAEPAAESAQTLSDKGQVAQVGHVIDGRIRLHRRLARWRTECWQGTDELSGESILAFHHTGMSSSQLERFWNEVTRLEKSSPRNCINVLGCQLSDDAAWVITPAVGDVCLRDALSSGQWTEVKALGLFRDLLQAARELHAQDISLFLLTPEHVFQQRNLAPRDQAEWQVLWSGDLSRFGTTESLQESDLGQIRYLSPEQCGLTADRDGPLSTLYTIASLVFESLTGRPPFTAESTHDHLYQVSTSAAPRVRDFRPDVSSFLDEMLGRCLHKHPIDRYQSLTSVLHDVELLLQSLTTSGREPDAVVGATDIRRRLTPPSFVARRNDLEQLLEQVEKLHSGDAVDVFLEAESGLGKSWMLQEFHRRIVHKGVDVYVGRATNDVGEPFQLLKNVVRGVIERARHDTALANRIRQNCAADAATLLSAFPRLAELLGGHDHLQSRESYGQVRTLAAVCRLLKCVGSPERPCVVILEDGQWQLEFVVGLFRFWKLLHSENHGESQHVMLVTSFRSEELQHRPERAQLPQSHWIRLERLSDTEIDRIAISMAGPLPVSALNLIRELSNGSPFMATSVLYGLVESKSLIAGDQGWELDESQCVAVRTSDDVAEVLTGRLNALQPETRRYLEVGAVLGEEFDHKFSLEMSGLPQEVVGLAVTDACDRQLLWHRPGSTTCRFVHDKIRQALLWELDATDRQQLHLRIAQSLERSSPDRLAELAYHYDAANQPERAFHYAFQAANQARERHALEIAQQQYRIALRCGPGQPQAKMFAVLEGLGDIQMLQGDYTQARSTFDEASALAETRLDHAKIRAKQGELCIKRGDMDTAIEHFEAGLKNVSIAPPGNRLRLLCLLAKEGVRQGWHSLWKRHRFQKQLPVAGPQQRLRLKLLSDFSHASWYCRSKALTLWAHLRGLNDGECFQPTPEVAQAYSDHAPAMILIPWFARAYQYSEISYRIREQLGEAWGLGQSLHFQGVVHYANCRYRDCIDTCERAIRILERTGDYWQVHIARYQVAAAKYRLGDFSGAVEACRRNFDSGVALGDEQASGIILDVWVRATEGQLDPDILSSELARKREDKQGAAQVLLAQAIFLIHRGEYPEAIEHLEQARALVNDAGIQNPYTSPINVWLVVAWRLWAERDDSVSQEQRQLRIASAKRCARSALRVSSRIKNDLPQLHRELAILCGMEGRRNRCRAHLELSRRYAMEHQAQYELALTLQTIKSLSVEFGWRVSDELQAQIDETRKTLDSVTAATHPTKSTSSISLADQFDTLLTAGRRILSARTVDTICDAGEDAARRLLRVTKTRIHWRQDAQLSSGVNLRDSDIFDLSGEAAASDALLSYDITVREQTVASLKVQLDDGRQVWDGTENQIAEFIAGLIGAALENAEGFAELQELNDNLELRVQERTEELEDRASQLARSNHELETVATALRRTQARLVDSIRVARQASEAKSRFLAVMSHEIRTPMNGIIGMTQLALNTNLDRRQRGYLQTVSHSAKTLLAILNDVLDFSKIEAGKLEVERIEFELHDCVVEACRLLMVRASEKSLKFYCLIDPRVPCTVLGDPNRIRQVLLNLLGNAIKFTHDGFVAVHVNLDTSTEEDRVRFEVRDSGVGIPPDAVQQIFEAFDQADASITRRFGGTGLGLSISRQLVSLMGGSLEVQSEVGMGSCFQFSLPLSAVQQELDRQSPHKRLLVYSQDPVFCDHLMQSLKASGHHVDRVDGQQELQQRIPDPSDCQYDLLLLDFEQFGLYEEQLLVTAADLTPTALLLPAGFETDPALQLTLNSFPYLIKPFTERELTEILRQENEDDSWFLQDLGVEPDHDVVTNSCHETPTKVLKLLVVDDSEINLMVVNEMIRALGHEAVTVDNGAEAVQLFQQSVFDAVLMDLEMPDIDGVTATRKIRQHESAHQLPRTPIYALTAHVVEEFRSESTRAGMDGFLTKPIDQDELEQFLNQLSFSPDDAESKG